MDKKISCLVVDDEPMAREIMIGHLSKIDNMQVIASCANAVEAFNKINEHQIDLIFLDINMPDISGLSFAKSINKEIKIIFTTAYRDYALDGFDLQAVDYLLKPVSFERLARAVNLYAQVFHQQKERLSPVVQAPQVDAFMFVRADRKMLKVNFAEILYVESFSDYVKIHTNHSTVVTRETIGNVEARLPLQQFIRIHRSYILSVAHIDSYTNEYVEINKVTLPISRSYKAAVLEKLQNSY